MKKLINFINKNFNFEIIKQTENTIQFKSTLDYIIELTKIKELKGNYALYIYSSFDDKMLNFNNLSAIDRIDLIDYRKNKFCGNYQLKHKEFYNILNMY